jgi:uncharacterized membrane protein
MKPFKQKINLNQIPRWVPIVILIIAIIGFVDATYVTIEHFQNIIPPCTTGGCEIVLTSAYSQILGIPVSLIGSVYYLVMIILTITFLDTKKELILRTSSLLSTFGALASIYFIIVMAFILREFCQYCALSALSSLTYV